MRVAVAGNPNSGKTTLFNALTGARARVGNYPGVTVERKEAPVRLPNGTQVNLIDIPGCYSLTARSPEEEVAHAVLGGMFGEGRPDWVVCVVDATQLARGLYLTVQLLELGLPLVLALNMMDLAKARGVNPNIELLAQRLGVPVVPISARHGDGLPALLQHLQGAPPATEARLCAHLSAADHQAVEAVRSAAGPTSVGTCLWLLTSNLQEVRIPLAADLVNKVARIRADMDAQGQGNFNRRLITARYNAVDTLLDGVLATDHAAVDARTEAIDRVLLHPVWGGVVFVSSMFLLFQAVFAWAEPLMQGIEHLMGSLSDAVTTWVPGSHTQSLLVHGVLAGVGSVLTFLPQIALLFFGLTLLEESGYMARAAFLLDRLMRRVGLHGKAFIPLMSSFACAVPGIMAARTVESQRDRLVTILVAPFMSCSARLPVYTLVIAAVFANSKPLFGVLSVGGLAIFSMYLLGFVAAIGTAWLLKRTVLRAPLPPLLLELPIYRVPSVRTVGLRVLERCRVFVRETGKLIVALSVVLWALLNFPQVQPSANLLQQQAALAQLPAAARPAAETHWQRQLQAYQLENSVGGQLGRMIEPLIAPLGFDWRIGIGLVASFAAREVLVSTLGQVYALDADTAPDSPSLRAALRADVDPHTGAPRFTALRGISLMVFFVLAMQCLSTVSVVRRETNSWRWPMAQLVYMNGLAYLASLLVYQGGRALGLGMTALPQVLDLLAVTAAVGCATVVLVRQIVGVRGARKGCSSGCGSCPTAAAPPQLVQIGRHKPSHQ